MEVANAASERRYEAAALDSAVPVGVITVDRATCLRLIGRIKGYARERLAEIQSATQHGPLGRA
jgi:hypothetical protein